MFLIKKIKRFKNLDWILITSTVLLITFGLLSIYSSSLGRGSFISFRRQLIFSVIGILLMFLFSFFPWRIFQENGQLVFILYLLSLLSLLGLFFFAPAIRGVRRWYKVGPVSIDPAEFVKIILIILLAKYFSMRHVEMYRIKHVLLSGLYVFLPTVLTFFQPDFGSVLVFGTLWVAILIVSGIKLRHFLILCLVFAVIFSLSWVYLMQDYQKGRIINFLIPTDPLGENWSKNQAQIAIGSGGLFGQGWFKGSQTRYGFLPVPQTDFIFAAIAEETGLVGVIILMSLFLILIWRILKIALNSRSNFPRLFGVGLVAIFILQIFVNVGMNLGILPIIGIALPFVSYGGSGLVTNLIALGILQNIKNNP